ncbi:MAG TPA: alginate lyase family protein, partial [Tepidisphaeraceae bacterium]
LASTTRATAQATRPTAAWQTLGGEEWKNWTGIERDGKVAVLRTPGEAVFDVPAGPRGAYKRGLYEANDSTIDVRPWHAVRFDVEVDRDDAPLTLALKMTIPPQKDRQNFPQSTAARAGAAGKGWHTVTVPIDGFDFKRGQSYFLKYVQQLSVRAAYDGKTDGQVRLRNVRLVRGNDLAVDADVRGGAGDGSAPVSYAVTVTNCSDAPRMVNLAIEHKGWEGMAAEVSPATMALKPGESGQASVRVSVPESLPGGGREKQRLVVSAQDGSSPPQAIEFTTIRRMPYPYVIHTRQGWDDLRRKVQTYEWAKEEAAAVIKAADAFEVPVVPPGGIPSDQGTPAVYKSYIEQRFFSVALAWKLTGDKRHAEKAALFLRRLADPENGYPVTLHAVSQGIPQEGGFFETCAAAYDMIQDSGALSDLDRKQIEHTFRLYLAWNVEGLGNGGISNWSLFNLCPAAMCALAIQDMDLFDKLMHGQGGIIDHLRFGMMEDGWWYEMSLSYNLGCAEVVTKLALAAQPFGVDLLRMNIPAAMTKDVGLRPFEYQKFLGMAFGKYGPLTRNTITLKQMWDGVTAYPDYRGMMFGMGDGHEQNVAGGPFELAYFAFRDPAYAAVLKRSKKRDLLYGVPELPEKTPELYTITAKSDNAGIAVLRSQTPGREPREQIQAAFKYGTHGSYHGHFDRISLLSLMRYGRSFYNPETSWFGYGSYMYKWWVQVSLSHNMVVVDGKMQEPQECRTLLFHPGTMFQAIAAETTARWSHPPYFGGYDQLAKVKSGDAPFVPIPEPHPAPADLTEFTEPVRQRRLLIVTDDYVVMADALSGDRAHTFDNLLHLRGATVATQPNVRHVGQAAQFDESPLSSGQFITGIDRYTATAPALVESVHRVGREKNWETGGAKSLSVPGELKINAHVLWPVETEILRGSYAESRQVNKKLTYEVIGDNKPLANGTFGAWILGSGPIDVDVTGVAALRLTTQTNRGKTTANTLFWGDARVVLADGREIPIAELDAGANGSTIRMTAENVIPAAEPGKDYDNGPVRIAGHTMTTAVAAEPGDIARPGVVTVNLAGLNAVRFKASVGGDWPVGDEEQLRRMIAVRTAGTSARFLTVLDPHERSPTIKSAVATSPDALRVELVDGRVQEIAISGLDDPQGKIDVRIGQSKGGQAEGSEDTKSYRPPVGASPPAAAAE